MTPEDFLNDNSRTTFISRIAAFLNIPTDKLKIVGIKSTSQRGLASSSTTSVDVVFVVEADPIGIP